LASFLASVHFHPHASSAAILGDELDAGFFEGPSDIGNCLIRYFDRAFRLGPFKRWN
jgi:hypothetical protein